MVHVIKVYLDDGKNEKQIRRLAVGSDVVNSFQLLKEKIRILFQLPTVSFDVKWRDSENDEILMSSDGELAQALANADDSLLKLFVGYGQSVPKVQQTETKSTQDRYSGEVHPHVVCDACNGSVCGDRYKCLQCKDFDLCSFCHSGNKHPYHDMIKLVKPSFAPREWTFLGSRKLWRSMFGHVARGSFSFPSDPQSSSSTSSEESQVQSPCKDMGNALHKFLNGDFVAAEKLFAEGLGSFLHNWPGGVDVRLETSPGKRPSREFKKCAKNKKDKEEDAPTPSTSDKGTEKNENVEATEEKTEAQPPKCEETVQQEQVQPTQVCGLFANSGKSSPEVMDPESTKVENEIKSSDTGEREKSPVNDDNSACAEGWTLLQHEETEKQEVNSVEPQKKETEKMPIYPSLEKVEVEGAGSKLKASSIEEEGNVIHTNDPMIINALIKMQAMGFTNEGGWLERLLVTKKGNINEALDALYPFTRQ